MKSLIEIIEKMLKVIPCEEEDFFAKLDDIRSSVSFAPTETLPFWWNEVAELLETYIPDKPDWTEWQQDIVGTFVNSDFVKKHPGTESKG